jgi:hypothetical protein
MFLKEEFQFHVMVKCRLIQFHKQVNIALRISFLSINRPEQSDPADGETGACSFSKKQVPCQAEKDQRKDLSETGR